MLELPTHHGFAIDRARNCLAHAIAIVTDDWQGSKKLANEVLADATSAALASGLTGANLALSIIGALDKSRDGLPV